MACDWKAWSLEQAVGAIMGHESVHATDNNEINKDITSQVTGTTRSNSEREARPEFVEQKIIEEPRK